MILPENISVAAAVNDRQTLEKCLASSPDLNAGTTLRVYEKYVTAGQAYNAAMDDCDTSILVLAHQDVYLPRNFIAQLSMTLNTLTLLDPGWAVAGVVGAQLNGRIIGHTWSSGLGRLIGDSAALPDEVVSLDEMLLIVRTDRGLRFDELLPGFHLYGTDIVQSARQAGWRAYAIAAPAIHHSRPVMNLGGSYRKAYRYMQVKWRSVLPIANPVMPIVRSRLPIILRDLRMRWKKRGIRSRAEPVGTARNVAIGLGFEEDDR